MNFLKLWAISKSTPLFLGYWDVSVIFQVKNTFTMPNSEGFYVSIPIRNFRSLEFVFMAVLSFVIIDFSCLSVILNWNSIPLGPQKVAH